MIIDGMRWMIFTDFFGDAFEAFSARKDSTKPRLPTLIGMGRATLNTYTSGVDGKRRRPPAELLTKACVLLGFEFEYEGHIIVARKKGKQALTEESNYISSSHA